MSPFQIQSPPPKARRRWPRFRLRTLFVLLTLACLWLGWQAKRARDQKQAVAAIRAAGGNIIYTYQVAPNGTLKDPGLPDSSRPLAPAWLRDALGEDFFITAYSVMLPSPAPGGGVQTVNTQVSDETLKHLAKLPRLKSLGIGALELTDSSLHLIAELPQVEHIVLRSPRLTDAGIAHLARLPRLKTLSIAGEQFSDQSIVALRAFPQLEWLTLNGGHMTNDGLAHLKHLPKLRRLALSGTGPGGGVKTKMTGAGLKHVAEVAELVDLQMYDFDLNDDDLEPLSRLTKLRSASFSGTGVTAAGMAKLKKALPQAWLTASTGAGSIYPPVKNNQSAMAGVPIVDETEPKDSGK